jgi:uncharacterized protein (TIGR02266 family)
MESASIEEIASLRAVDPERRRSNRAEFIVRVGYATVDEFFSDFSRDINEGGLFIETDFPCPVGTEISLSFQLPGTEECMDTTGRVVRVTRDRGSEPAGMGIEFDSLNPEFRDRIDSLVRSLRIESAPRTAA